MVQPQLPELGVHQPRIIPKHSSAALDDLHIVFECFMVLLTGHALVLGEAEKSAISHHEAQVHYSAVTGTGT